MLRNLQCACVALVLVVSTVSGAYAQATASISGVVKDTGGGVVPGVSVVVKEDATSRAHETVTDSDGRYQVSALLAGSVTTQVGIAGCHSLGE